MKITNKINFGIQRKIVANMTTESWETIPHVTYNYEPDVTDFMREYKKLNFNRKGADKITVNTLMLKVISDGLGVTLQLLLKALTRKNWSLQDIQATV